MILKNHIAYRFLTDETLWFEMIESQEPDLYKLYDEKKTVPDSIHSLYSCLHNKLNKPYVVANSVIENLDMFTINKQGEHYNWEVFNQLKEQKVTFIFNDNTLLRMLVTDDVIWFCHMKFTFAKGDKNNGQMYWIMFFIKRDTGELCEHFKHPDVRQIEEFVYKFLCFFYLTDNNEEVVKAGKTTGTKKTGKILNDFNFPITLVTSKWNTTVIRTEQFGVRGHFRLQPYGTAMQNYKLIFIEPFVKNGYVRKAEKLNHIN